MLTWASIKADTSGWLQALWTHGVGLADGAAQAGLQGLTACMAALTQASSFTAAVPDPNPGDWITDKRWQGPAKPWNCDGSVRLACSGVTSVCCTVQWLQQEGIAACLHKEAASIAQGEAPAAAGGAPEQGPVAAAQALAADLARLGPSPEGHTSHLQYLVSLLTRERLSVPACLHDLCCTQAYAIWLQEQLVADQGGYLHTAGAEL